MSKGVLCFAHNNGEIDYIKQAVLLAKRISKHLNLPTSVVTSTPDSLSLEDRHFFDSIIEIQDETTNSKRYNDGQLLHKSLYFKNHGRCQSYDLSPYEKTLVLDTDYIVCNDVFKHAFDLNHPFQIYKNGIDLCSWRKHKEFDYINDKGIEFYWATCVYFEKTKTTKLFFDLLKHLQKNWKHYSEVYDLGSRNFRNDHLFSIGIHMMNGFTNGSWAKTLPGTMYYTLDKDMLYSLTDEKLVFLLQNEKQIGDYILASIKNSNVHVMNKFSLERVANV